MLTYEMARYACVGAIAFVADWTVLYTFTEFFNVHYLLSATLGFVCGLTINYLLCVVWVFGSNSGMPRYAEFLVFLAIGVVGLGITDFFMFFFTKIMGMVYLESKLLSVGLVFFWNYYARKYSLFNGTNTKLGGDCACR